MLSQVISRAVRAAGGLARALGLCCSHGRGCTVRGVASAEHTLQEEFAFLSPPVGFQREYRS